MFLNKGDYIPRYKEENLDTLTEGRESILDDVQQDVIEEISSYIRQRFDVDQIFIDITKYDFTTAYTAGDFVFITADDFDDTAIYNANDLVVFSRSDEEEERVYAATATTVAGESPETTPAKWDEQGLNYDIFEALQDNTGSLPDTTADWQKNDPRNPMLVRIATDLALYEIHSRTKPRNMPELRLERRTDAIDWLMKVTDPRKNVTPDLPLKTFEDKTGNDISWNSDDKLIHDY